MRHRSHQRWAGCEAAGVLQAHQLLLGGKTAQQGDNKTMAAQLLEWADLLGIRFAARCGSSPLTTIVSTLAICRMQLSAC
jgi:hypothetical protein